MANTSYNIDGWYIQLPQEWKMSLDKEQNPPQVIFEAEEGSVILYISTWNFDRPETGEIASVETVASFFIQAFEQKGIERQENFSQYYPEKFDTYVGKSINDGEIMIYCVICAEGRALTYYIACDEDVDYQEYLKYIKFVEQD